MTGHTYSADFPTTAGAFDTTFNGADDAFVTKLDASGAASSTPPTWAEAAWTRGSGIAVDGAGNAYLTGDTRSRRTSRRPRAPSTRPTTARDLDAFVTKLDASGAALVYSTYLGGSDGDSGGQIAVDGAGNAYVTGFTGSTDFPTTPGAFDTTYNGSLGRLRDEAGRERRRPRLLDLPGRKRRYDAGHGIARRRRRQRLRDREHGLGGLPDDRGRLRHDLQRRRQRRLRDEADASGAALVYSTYLGGSSDDFGNAIAVDAAGSAYVTGDTFSADFPTTAGALDTTFNGGVSDVFVTKLSASGAAPLYSTYLGGSSDDFGNAVAVDSAGSAHVTGDTFSADFPTTAGAFDTTWNGDLDAFVTEIDLVAVPPPPPPQPQPPPPQPPPPQPPPPPPQPPPPQPPPPVARPAVVRCVVPNVKGKTVAQARRLLASKRCGLGRVRHAYSAKIKRGRVISQSRRPGARLPRGTRVGVVVSRGRRR